MKPIFATLSFIRRFAQDRKASVAMIFGLAFIPVLLCAGGMAVDVTRIYDARIRLGSALDAGALAIGSIPTGLNSTSTTAQKATAKATLQTALNNFLSANYPSNAIGTNVSATITTADVSQPVIDMTATSTVPMTIMKIIGFNNVTIQVASEITKGISGLEVALVLDNTGSMNCGDGGSDTSAHCTQGIPPGVSHIKSLVSDVGDPSTGLVHTLFAASTQPGKLKVAVVPFVTAVNVGTALNQSGLLNSYVPPRSVSGGYNDENGNHILKPDGTEVAFNAAEGNSNPDWKGCVIEPWTSGEDTSGTGPDITEPAGGWVASATLKWSPYYWNNGVAGNSWATTNATTHVTTYSIAYVQIDGNVTTATNNSHGPNLGCPTPMLRLSSDEPTVQASVNIITAAANSGTDQHVGMIWGWRALSPNPPFSDGAAYTDKNWIKAVVLFTDGINDMGQTQLTGMGVLPDGRLGTTVGCSSSTCLTTAENHQNSRLTQVCTAMKAAGISIWAIGLGVTNPSTTHTNLANCAGGPNGGIYIDASNAADLNTAFQKIASQLNTLRLSK